MKLLSRPVGELLNALVVCAVGLLMIRPALQAQAPPAIPPHPLTQLPQASPFTALATF
jgi:hypothetical protein